MTAAAFTFLCTPVQIFLRVLVGLPLLIGVYAYFIYPAILKVVASQEPPAPGPDAPPHEWPQITITVPCYNEEASLRSTLEALLALDYPAEKRQILVISDASTDRTDEIAREFAVEGVELVRLPSRLGKSAAENAAGPLARGEIIVNIDATIRVERGALKALVSAFDDETVGVASGRDVSVASLADAAAAVGHSSGESGYVGYEMKLRALETRVQSIVGASGCFYGIRSSLYDSDFPASLSRDFAVALLAVDRGYRAVSVDDALCYVPEARSLAVEFRRKIRTMAHGLQTLWHMRHLLDPTRFGVFAWMLFSHKLARWLVYPALVVAAVALALMSTESLGWAILLALALGGVALGIVGMRWPAHRAHTQPRVIRLAGFALASNVAGVLAWINVVRGREYAVWEPTRR